MAEAHEAPEARQLLRAGLEVERQSCQRVSGTESVAVQCRMR